MRSGRSWGQRSSLCRKSSCNLLVGSKRSSRARRYWHQDARLLSPDTSTNRFPHAAVSLLRYPIPSNEATPSVGKRRQSFHQNATEAQRTASVKVPRISSQKLRSPNAWIDLLDPFLPPSLQANEYERKGRVGYRHVNEKDVCQNILAILDSARKEQHAGIDLLAYMIVNSRKPAALHIVSRLLKDIASRFPGRSQSRMPSNIQWPGRTMNDACKKPVEIRSSALQVPRLTYEENDDPRYSFIMTRKRETAMSEIWSTLGALFAQAADLPEIQAKEVNNAALLILGQIHNLDLVPESVYSYRYTPLTTTVRKPPILHLVSSRILAAISDATWRQQQDSMIEKAASYGISYETIGRDPPGGRFRLKVRSLGPEIWLEFILWCCVEGGFPNAGIRIIRGLRSQTDNPWFAVTWSPESGRSQTSPIVDWQRVRARYGGSVGLKEGYSGDKPFVEMPPRTISTEVILGLLDASINSITRSASHAGGALTVQRNMFELVAFLEPHDLPLSYFNYLAVRLMQADVFRLPQYASTLHAWYKRLASMKALKPAHPPQKLEPVLHLTSISAYSEVFAGILQQSLDGCIQGGDIHRALDIFNTLQETVDMSKLQAIDFFLYETATIKGTSFAVKDQSFNAVMKEFVGSHGQLPLYKLTGLIDLATDTGLTGFVQWLLYNDDPDGPLVPHSAYQDPSLSRALIRFASSTQDTTLLRDILRAHRRSRRLFSVNLLRTVINTNIALLQFEQAYSKLIRLSQAQGGGLGLTNLAQLAAVVIKLESGNFYNLPKTEMEAALRRGHRLLEHMLDGDFDNRTGTFQAVIRRSFRQQIGVLMRVFQFDPTSLLSTVGEKYTNKYSVANKAGLAPTIFNYILEAIVQQKGSVEGMRLWNLCCQSNASSDELSFDDDDDDDDIPIVEYSPHGNDTRERETHGSDALDKKLDKSSPELEDEVDTILSDKANATSSKGSSTQPVASVDPESTTFGNQFFPTSQPLADTFANHASSLVTPSQQTLRLIIRGAVRERREALSHGKSIDLQKSVLAWAAEELKSFGASPRMIAMEVEEPLKQPHLRKLNEQRFALRGPKNQSQAVVRRVSSSFMGQSRTRPHNRKRPT